MAKAKILLVEDSKAQASVAIDFLKKIGYEVIGAENGKSAIKIAKSKGIDIRLLDLVLPDISGNEACRWLKLNEDTKGLPIIMLTVKDGLTDKVAGLEAGADDYLPKPYNEIELNARIYASLRTKALQSASRLIKAVSEHKFSEIADEQITVSIGIAGAPDPSIDTEEKLIHASDMALYEAKKKGRNRAELG